MDILKFYELLDETEKRKLYFLLKKELVEDPMDINIEDWCYKFSTSCRVTNILLYGKSFLGKTKTILISEVTKKEFLSNRNAGIKTWNEFVEIRGY